ncbi:unnamed protein product [Brachionus calyciflorus]|uniref:EF-hand domain-containing protein n=1 Tax=Brachionus calyciflorus TaxID=104777 RepID=A0A813S5J9_9BILA|nr:unnamed protein product [Brachionus calyciflorus]
MTAYLDNLELHKALEKVIGIVEMEQERDLVSNAKLFDHLITAFCTNTDLIPLSVSKDYVGVHLTPIYEINNLKLLLKYFKNDQILDPFYTLKIINDAKEKMLKLPNILECIIEDPKENGCIVVGDLHGNFDDLYHLIDKFGLPGCEFRYIFNGDYVDRGSKQMEVLLIILYSFLVRSDRVYINRGNHEDIRVNSNKNFMPNFMTVCRKMYGKYGSCIYKAANELFTTLPLATSFENKVSKYKYFIVHGGISDTLDLDYVYFKLNRFRFDKVTLIDSKLKKESKAISEMLWSDPIILEDGVIGPRLANELNGCYFNTYRNLGCLFGADISEKFCKKFSFNAIIRSHEMRDMGFSKDHPRCFTIFSASYYSGCNNFGAVFKFETKSKLFDVYKYKNLSNNESTDELIKKSQILLKQFKCLIRSKEKELLKEFELYDLEKNCTIQTDLWADILSKTLNSNISVHHLKAIKNYICECSSSLDCVYYKSLFKRKRFRRHSQCLKIVTNLFNLLDADNDKKISLKEAQNAIKTLNSKMETNFSQNEDCVKFFEILDKNCDEYIDLDEFINAFTDSELLLDLDRLVLK